MDFKGEFMAIFPHLVGNVKQPRGLPLCLDLKWRNSGLHPALRLCDNETGKIDGKG
jgi:hypothetical protein